jgi:hypothetical protein
MRTGSSNEDGTRKDGSTPEAPGDGEDWLGEGELAAHTEQSL